MCPCVTCIFYYRRWITGHKNMNGMITCTYGFRTCTCGLPETLMTCFLLKTCKVHALQQVITIVSVSLWELIDLLIKLRKQGLMSF